VFFWGSGELTQGKKIVQRKYTGGKKGGLIAIEMWGLSRNFLGMVGGASKRDRDCSMTKH